LIQWCAEAKDKGDVAFAGSGKRSGTAAEIDRLKRELEQVKEERDILKKATAFVVRECK
jgi:transposase